MSTPTRYIAVGILQHQDKILMAQRHEGTFWAGYWEFPGGKIEAGELVGAALDREMQEEIGILPLKKYPWVRIYHQYPTHCVELNFYRITEWKGDATGREGQTVRWVSLDEAHTLSPQLPTCDQPLRWLSLPQQWMHFSVDAPDAVDTAIAAVQAQSPQGLFFDCPTWQGDQDSLKSVFDKVLAFCQTQNIPCIVHSHHPKAWWQAAQGVLLSEEATIALEERPLPLTHWVGSHCAHLEQVLYARQLGTDFVILAAPEAENWDAFSALAMESAQPVLVEGLTLEQLEIAQEHGAHGLVR